MSNIIYFASTLKSLHNIHDLELWTRIVPSATAPHLLPGSSCLANLDSAVGALKSVCSVTGLFPSKPDPLFP